MPLNDDVEIYTVDAAQEVQIITVSVPGPPGQTGPIGPQGIVGPANTLTVGTTTAGPPSSNPVVTITGSAPNQVINFTIPRGADGADGVNGTNGVDGAAGINGTNGANGTNGTNGAPGPANSITIGTVSTLAAGATATATLTGSSPNQVLNLGIPAGAQGSAGAGAPDATTTTKGSIQLAGDLAGTAASPTVPGLATKAALSHTHTASQISDSTAVGQSVLTAVDAPTARTALGVVTATTSVQGIIQVADNTVTLAGANATRAVTPASLKAVADTKAALSHTHPVTDLTATGTRDATTFLRGDNTWAIPSGGSGGSVTSANITDATTVGRAVLVATDAATARTAIGAGTSSLVLGTTSTTALAGNYAPPIDGAAGTGTMRTLGTGSTQAAAGNHTHTAANITDSTTVGRSVLTATDAPTARTAIGAGTASTKTDVGLGNVDNTADTAKPVSTAQKTYIDSADTSLGNRLTTLEGFGKVLVLSAAASVPAATPANTIIFRTA